MARKFQHHDDTWMQAQGNMLHNERLSGCKMMAEKRIKCSRRNTCTHTKIIAVHGKCVSENATTHELDGASIGVSMGGRGSCFCMIPTIHSEYCMV